MINIPDAPWIGNPDYDDNFALYNDDYDEERDDYLYESRRDELMEENYD